MKIQLIKIKDKFILVSDEDAKNNELLYNIENNTICRAMGDAEVSHFKIIAGVEFLPKVDFSLLKEEDCKTIGWVDIEKLFDEELSKETPQIYDEHLLLTTKHGFKIGFKTGQSLNDKMFSLEDMRKAIEFGNKKLYKSLTYEEDRRNQFYITEYIQSLQQTSWGVEVEMERKTYQSVDNKYEKLGEPFNTLEPKITNGKIKVTKILW